MKYAGIDVRRIRNIKQAGTKGELKRAIHSLPDVVRMSKAKEIVKHYRSVYNAAIEHYCHDLSVGPIMVGHDGEVSQVRADNENCADIVGTQIVDPVSVD